MLIVIKKREREREEKISQLLLNATARWKIL